MNDATAWNDETEDMHVAGSWWWSRTGPGTAAYDRATGASARMPFGTDVPRG